MIRQATIGDLPSIVRLMRNLQPRTPYGDVPLDIATIGQAFGQCVNSALGFAVVAEHKQGVTGMLLGAAQPLWFSRKRQASDFINYAESPGDGYRMLRKFIDWAWSIQNVVEITMGQSSGIDIERTAQIYERAGLRRVGAIFTAVREAVATEVAA